MVPTSSANLGCLAPRGWGAAPLTWPVLVAALTAGCGFPSFDPPSLVNSVRVLAIKAEPPEASPGESVALSAAIFDPAGVPLPLWSICAPDPVAGAAGCAEFLTTVGMKIPDVMIGPTATFDVPAEALDGLEPGEVTQAVAAHIVCGGSDFEKCFPTMEMGEDFTLSETLEIAIKRITISESATPNLNPAFATISHDFGFPAGLSVMNDEITCGGNGTAANTNISLDDDSLMDCGGGAMAHSCIAAGDVIRFNLVATPESPEEYTEEVDGKPQSRTEELITSFFATSGRFSGIRDVGGAKTGLQMCKVWESLPEDEDAPVAGAGEVVQFWFVMRDGRGGVDFLERRVGIVP